MIEHDLQQKVVNRLLEDNREEFLDLFDAAVDRWLDKKFAQFGRWAIYGMLAALFVYTLKWAVNAGVFK